MTSTTFELTDREREACAISVMRAMLEDYSNDTEIPFSSLFFQFAVSPAYKMLFDYSTGLWMEGPDYFREIFLETLKPANSVSA